MRQIQRCLWSGVGLWLALGCGGEGGSGGSDTGGELDTGLPEETPLEDVTAEQYAAACEALRDRASSRLGPDKTVRGACEIFSGAFTNDPAMCRASADDCVVEVNDGTHLLSAEALDVTQFECVGGANDRAGCTVTVGEFETCMNDRLLAFERLLSQNTCSNAAMIDLVSAMNLANFASMDAPASCAQLGAECPAVDPFAAPP